MKGLPQTDATKLEVALRFFLIPKRKKTTEKTPKQKHTKYADRGVHILLAICINFLSLNQTSQVMPRPPYVTPGGHAHRVFPYYISAKFSPAAASPYSGFVKAVEHTEVYKNE